MPRRWSGLLDEQGRGAQRPVLVPNERGLDRALAAGGAVAVFGSVTETFARKNLNRSVEESLAMFAPVVERACWAEGLWVRGYVSMCFGDPWEWPRAGGAGCRGVLAD